ncbi:hypothetical protein CMI38_04995 [Candidatus Pacearchaeota archaeon]|jgi:D-glycero-alpha-D-manno-heptose-7-phosphate kinase|nr:hypothetical protein [Candidatus Pacearchaeota archaeon]|tara:strand:- start:23956 stop:24813 length:858 start_codon:yes stop_codon:yes gene_type:complete
MKIYARAPVRIDFGGGTTDIFPFTENYEGVVLNAGINRYVHGSLIALPNETKLEYHADIPTSSGLGTSGVMNVVWLALVNHFTDLKNKSRIAELAYDIERAMDVVGGKQDQYAAALGGINFLKFKYKKPPKIEQIKLRPKILKEFESRLFLYYTGPRLSSSVNAVVLNRIKKKEKRVIYTLNRIAKNARLMRDALKKEHLYDFANYLNHEWVLRKNLHPRITTKKIEDTIKFAKKNGALAAKVCGAGGGGCILFYSDCKRKLMEKLKKNIIDFKFDTEGLKIWKK